MDGAVYKWLSKKEEEKVSINEYEQFYGTTKKEIQHISIEQGEYDNSSPLN